MMTMMVPARLACDDFFTSPAVASTSVRDWSAVTMSTTVTWSGRVGGSAGRPQGPGGREGVGSGRGLGAMRRRATPAKQPTGCAQAPARSRRKSALGAAARSPTAPPHHAEEGEVCVAEELEVRKHGCDDGQHDEKLEPLRSAWGGGRGGAGVEHRPRVGVGGTAGCSHPTVTNTCPRRASPLGTTQKMPVCARSAQRAHARSRNHLPLPTK